MAECTELKIRNAFCRALSADGRIGGFAGADSGRAVAAASSAGSVFALILFGVEG